MVFCNKELQGKEDNTYYVTILILIDGFLQYDGLLDDFNLSMSQSLF